MKTIGVIILVLAAFLVAACASPGVAVSLAPSGNTDIDNMCQMRWGTSNRIPAEESKCRRDQKRDFDAISAMTSQAIDLRVKKASEADVKRGEALSALIEHCKGLNRQGYYIDWVLTRECVSRNVADLNAGRFKPSAPSASLGGSGYPPTMRTFCAKEWPNDFRMQEYCIKQQIDGWRRVGSMIDRAPAGLKTAYGQCAIDWRWGKGDNEYDWRMVAYCMEKQRDAYTRVR
jgi:hypothetical protein